MPDEREMAETTTHANRHYTAADGPWIRDHGRRMIKRPHPVYALGPMEHAFTVDTIEGRLAGNVGDFVAHDPMSGHVWPIAASYVEQHYDEVSDAR